MKSVLALGFFIQITFALDFFNSKISDDNNIWLTFISKVVLSQEEIKRCAINIHLKNQNSLDHIAILKYLHHERFR